MKYFILNLWYTILYQFDQHKKDIPVWWYQQKDFDEQDDWVKRVTIAQDVIAQIKAKRYSPKQGRYINKESLTQNDELSGSIKENFEKIDNCKVCGIGACFLSIVKYKNNVNFEDVQVGFIQFVHNEKFRKLLLSIFSYSQLRTIEYAFECGINTTYRTVEDEDIDLFLKAKATCFGQKYYYDDSRLLAIMENIVDNRGEFKP